MTERVVGVPVGERAYDVVVGAGTRAQLHDLIPGSARRAAVLTPSALGIEVDPGIEHRTFPIDGGEEAKSLATVERLCRELAAWGFTRTDVVIGLGGGMVTDVAGFVAAVYHRGVPVVHVPTTLLGMVDAAIGGKTGVNIPEGKNLVGAFWQPSAVVCDTELLATLPEREWRSGYGEIAKYHFLTGGGTDLAGMPLDELVAECVGTKAAVVGADEREGGRRALLNYGHTLAHALEVAERFDLRHGEAVAVGLAYAAALARVLGRIDDAGVARHHRVLDGYGLDARLPASAHVDELIALMGRDKKKSGDGLTFVLDGPAGVEVVPGVERDAVERAFAAMAS